MYVCVLVCFCECLVLKTGKSTFVIKALRNTGLHIFTDRHKGPVMVDLFLDKVLVKNNKDRDELDTEREIILRLQNRILMLFFGSSDCERCQEFAPTLKDFFKKLTDEFYVERSAQLVLLYISLDTTEEQQDRFLKELPKRCLFLPFQDPYRKELEVMFEVEDIPTVVVLRPDCSVLSPNAVMEICSLGTHCYQNWQEAAELIDRNFLMNEEYDESKRRSFTDAIRRQKYKVEDKKKKKKKEQDGEDDDDGGGGGPWG